MTQDNIVIKKNGGILTIDTTRVEQLISKKLNFVVSPQTSANWPSGPIDVQIVDLLQIEERYLIDGTISGGAYTGDVKVGGTATLSAVQDRKNELRNMVRQGGVVTATWEGIDIGANFDGKLSFIKTSVDGIEPDDEEVGYTVKFTLLVGVDL